MPSVESALEKEIAAYETMRSALETEHLGEWVVVHDRELVGVYESFGVAAADAVGKFGRGPYLIREIGEVFVRLPASALYNPVFEHASRTGL